MMNFEPYEAQMKGYTEQKSFFKDAREEATKQWNKTACGELDGNKEKLDYFLRPEENRYHIQSWMRDYIPFSAYKGKKVLEIGVEQGTDLAQFGRAGALCHGIDITENHLLLTKKNFKLRNLNVELKACDATSIDFDDNTFDCVYSFGILHHVPNFEKCISEIYRVLKPGGTFIYAFYNKYSAYHYFQLFLWQGIFFGDLIKLGYDGLLSTIESGVDGINIKPYVKLYSKDELLFQLKDFNIEDINVFQLHKYHFLPNIKRLFNKSKTITPKLETFAKKHSSHSKLLDSVLNKLENKLGWYVVCKAIKSRTDEKSNELAA